MKIKYILISILLLNIAVHTYAQKSNSKILTGNILNESRLPVPFATAVLKNAGDSSVYKTVFCDTGGHFIFDALKAGSYFLKVAAVGYDTLVKENIVFAQTDTLIRMETLFLKRSVTVLSGVTVRSATPLIERTIDKTVVNVNNSITTEGATVLEVMKKLPGVRVSTDGQVTMNGRQGVNIYIDGKPSYLSAEDLLNLLSSMSASNVQKIELITNPSSKYDAAGTAGIINIVKKKNRKEGLNGSITENIGKGYFGRYSSGLTLSYKNKRYNFFFNNTYGYNKSFSSRSVTSDISGVTGKLITEQRSDNTGIGAGKNYRPTIGIDLYLSNRTTISLSGTSGIGSSNNRLKSNMDISDSNRKKINQSDFTSSLLDKSFNYSIGASLLQLLDTSGKTLTIDLDYSSYNNRPLQKNLNSLTDANGNFISETDALMQQHRRLNIYSAKADIILPIKNKQRLEMGFKTSYVKANNSNDFFDVTGTQNLFDSANSSYSINSENINAAYINFYSPHKKMNLQAGLRAEQTIASGKQLITEESVYQNYLQLFPSVFLEYKPNEKHLFNARLGRRTERAAYNELVPFRRPQTATLFFQGNPNLRPQTSWHGEFAWTYQNKLTIALNYDIIRDYVRTLPFSDSNKVTITRIPINIRQAHSWDADIVYSKKVTGWWTTNNTVSFYQNSFKGQANGFSLNNPGMISVDLSITNSFQINNKLLAECNFEYSSKRKYVTSTFGAYSNLSFGIKRQVLKNKGSISLNVNNILQSENHNAIDRNSGLYQYSYFYSYSRYASVNFVYRFGKNKIVKAHISSGSNDEQKRAGN